MLRQVRDGPLVIAEHWRAFDMAAAQAPADRIAPIHAALRRIARDARAGEPIAPDGSTHCAACCATPVPARPSSSLASGPMAITRTTTPWSALLDAGRTDGRLVREAFEGARAPDAVALPDDLHPELLAGLTAAGIDGLYRHQAQALQAAWDGPTIVTTGTASGKSLCFNLPTLEVLCSDPKARALYLYPTKALAQDQARAIARAGPAPPHQARDLRRRHPPRGARARSASART